VGPRPRFDIGEIVRKFRPALEARHRLAPGQKKVLTAISRCRTAALGGHKLVCERGDFEQISYNSCRDRHCPKCQALAQEKWIAARSRRILAIGHFHVVFTLPAELRILARLKPAVVYQALLRAAADTLLELGKTRKGLTFGLTLILHTWTRELHFHPHVHVLISAGGLALDGASFKRIKEKFLLHLTPLTALFKKLMMKALRRLQDEGVFGMTKDAFGSLMVSLAGQKWRVYLKKAFKCAAFVLKYLGRYTHRIGISNSRLVAVTTEQVTFRSKDGRTVTLAPVAFLQRLVQHVLPERFKKIRHLGLYAAPKLLAQAKEHLGAQATPTAPPATWQEILLALTGVDATRCKGCGSPLYHTTLLPDRPWPRPARDPSPRSPP